MPYLTFFFQFIHIEEETTVSLLLSSSLRERLLVSDSCPAFFKHHPKSCLYADIWIFYS
jgi:hypothetical protein